MSECHFNALNIQYVLINRFREDYQLPYPVMFKHNKILFKLNEILTLYTINSTLYE